MSLSHDSLDLPRAFGPYLLLRRLAVGGMAEVYVARARGISGFEKLVAIKVIHPRYSEDEHFVTLLVEEAKISVLLTHVNVGQIFDLGVVDGTYYIALEYIEGADAYRMQRKASDAGVSVPIDVCMFIAAEVCHGLDYAHRKRDADGHPLRIVHRDISPQNVLVSFAGEVKIVDFGIAKAALRGGQTEAGVIKGKYYYMSPEQAWGDPMDHRSDIFSAGIVLYELLIGEMLYREDNIPALLDRVRKADIAPPHTRRAEVSPELSAIVMRALAKKPEDRFQSAHEMAQALMQLLYKSAPSFTAARVAQLMAQLFPVEIRKNAELAALASDESDVADAPPAKADPSRAVAARLPPAAARPARTAVPLEPPPTRAFPARPAAFELGDEAEEEEDDQTRNDVLPFRRALAMAAAAATGQTDTREVDAAPSDEPTRAVSGRAKREDATGPLRRKSAERQSDWEDDETSVLSGGAGAAAVAILQGAAPAPTPAVDPNDEDWADDSTMVDDGAVSASVPALLRERAAARAAVAAPSSAQRSSPAKPRPMPPPAKPRSMPPPAKPRSMPPPARRVVPPVPQAPQQSPSPPPYPQAYAQPPAYAQQAPQPPAYAQQAPQPPPYAQQAPQPPPYAQQASPVLAPTPAVASPFDPIAFAPAPVPVATSWPPAAAPWGAPASLDPRTGAAFDPFAPPPSASATTALYPAVDGATGSRRWLIFALFGAALLALLVVLGVSTYYASHRVTPAPQVASVPSGAHVRVDGVDVPGVTPLRLPAPLDPERAHGVEVILDQFEPYRIVIPAGDRQASHLAILTPK